MSSGVDEQTPNLLLTKPAISGSVDTWGGKLNTNFDILDDKVKTTTDTAGNALKKTSADVAERTAQMPLFYKDTVTVAAGDTHALLSQKMIKDMLNAAFPLGTILIWVGNTDTIPAGWALCNGQIAYGVQTPNFSDRFVMAAGGSFGPGYAGGNSTFNYAGTVGGTALSVEQMPQHSHGIVDNGHSHGGSFSGHSHNYTKRTAHKALSYQAGGSYTDQLWQGDDTTNNTGGASANSIATSHNGTGVYADYRGASWGHDHPFGISAQWYQFYPPFYAVCYIMKVQWF